MRSEASRKAILRFTAAIFVPASTPIEATAGPSVGHSSITITERQYAPWVKARQDQPDSEVMAHLDRRPAQDTVGPLTVQTPIRGPRRADARPIPLIHPGLIPDGTLQWGRARANYSRP
jgi:hypothetical protein